MAKKFFSSRSNRDRALRKVDVGQAIEEDGKFGIETQDDEPALDINEDVHTEEMVPQQDSGEPMYLKVPAYSAVENARLLANRLGHAVEVVSPKSGSTVQTVDPGVKPKRAKADGERQPRVKGDPTVKPIITSASNAALQRVMDRIDEARGDAEKLRKLDTFKRTSTYYKMAGRFLDALVAQAEADA